VIPLTRTNRDSGAFAGHGPALKRPLPHRISAILAFFTAPYICLKQENPDTQVTIPTLLTYSAAMFSTDLHITE
jgi:hypothetical protein